MSGTFGVVRRELIKKGFSKATVDALESAADAASAQTQTSGQATDVAALQAQVASLTTQLAAVSEAADDAALLGPVMQLNPEDIINIVANPATNPNPTQAKVRPSAAVAAGDFTNAYDAGSGLAVRQADATDPAKFANSFVLDAGDTSADVTVYFAGINTAVSPTARGRVWLSETAPGGYQTSAPAAGSAGHLEQVLGTAIPGVGVVFQPGEPVPL